MPIWPFSSLLQCMNVYSKMYCWNKKLNHILIFCGLWNNGSELMKNVLMLYLKEAVLVQSVRWIFQEKIFVKILYIHTHITQNCVKYFNQANLKKSDVYKHSKADNTKSSLTLQQFCLQKNPETETHKTLYNHAWQYNTIVMFKMKLWFRTTRTNHGKIKRKHFNSATTKAQAHFCLVWFQSWTTTVKNFLYSTYLHNGVMWC